jgi:hypothetical protein
MTAGAAGGGTQAAAESTRRLFDRTRGTSAMILPAVVLGLLPVAVARYTVSDPMSRARNWVDGREWEQDLEAANRKQVRYTTGWSW